MAPGAGAGPGRSCLSSVAPRSWRCRCCPSGWRSTSGPLAPGSASHCWWSPRSACRRPQRSAIRRRWNDCGRSSSRRWRRAISPMPWPLMGRAGGWPASTRRAWLCTRPPIHPARCFSTTCSCNPSAPPRHWRRHGRSASWRHSECRWRGGLPAAGATMRTRACTWLRCMRRYPRWRCSSPSSIRCIRSSPCWRWWPGSRCSMVRALRRSGWAVWCSSPASSRGISSRWARSRCWRLRGSSAGRRTGRWWRCESAPELPARSP